MDFPFETRIYVRLVTVPYILDDVCYADRSGDNPQVHLIFYIACLAELYGSYFAQRTPLNRRSRHVGFKDNVGPRWHSS